MSTLEHEFQRTLQKDPTHPTRNFALRFHTSRAYSRWGNPLRPVGYHFSSSPRSSITFEGITYRVELDAFFQAKLHLEYKGTSHPYHEVMKMCARDDGTHELHGRIYLVERVWDPGTKTGVARFLLFPTVNLKFHHGKEPLKQPLKVF